MTDREYHVTFFDSRGNVICTASSLGKSGSNAIHRLCYQDQHFARLRRSGCRVEAVRAGASS
jgi:hypothetical protein